MMRRMSFVLILIVLTGCVVTEEQANDIAAFAGKTAAEAALLAAPSVGMSPEAAGGIASAVGLAVTAAATYFMRRMAKNS